MPASDDALPSAIAGVSWHRRRWVRALAGVALLAGVWTVGVGYWLPGVLQPRIESAATDALGEPVRLKALSLSPWTLTARVEGLTVGAPDQPLLRVRQLEAQVSLASVWHLAPVLRRVQVVQPEVWLSRLDAQRFNISPMLAHLRARADAAPADEQGAPARFALFNISVAQGAVRYDDRVLGQSHVVDQIALGVPFLSSLPSQVDVAVQPLLKARINGSPLAITGTTRPFQDGQRAELQVRWRDVDVAEWLQHAQPLLPRPWTLTPRSGTLSTDLTVVFEQPPQAEVPRLVVQGGVTVEGLDLSLPTVPGVALAGRALGPVALGWQRLRLEGLHLQPLLRQGSVGRVVLDGAQVAAGTRDGVRWPVVQDVSVTVDGLDTADAAPPAQWRVKAKDDGGSQWQAQGAWQLARAQGQMSLSLQDGAVAPWWAALVPSARGQAGMPVSPQAGRLGLSAKVALSARPALSWQLSEGQLSLDGLQARVLSLVPGRPPGLADTMGWRALRLEGIEARSDGTVPRWSVAQLDLQGAQLRWQDTRHTPAARWQLSDAQLTVQGLSDDLKQVLQVQLDTRAQGAGRVRFKGSVQPQPLTVQGQVGVQSLELRVLQPYLAPYLNVTLAGAQAQLDGRLDLRWRPGRDRSADAQALSLRYRGGMGLDRLHLLDQVNDADVLRWRRLALRGTEVRWQDGALVADLGRIALEDFYGRVIVQRDGRLNLSQLVKRADAPAGETASLTSTDAPASPPPPTPAPATPATPATDTAPETAQDPGPDLRWRGITVQGGQVDFTDLYIQPNYSARLTRLAGTVSAVAARQPEPAELHLQGQVDDAAPLLIKGRLHPLGPRLYTDIEGSAKGVELTRLTPYAARYAGYAIERGTLSVDVRYKVQEGRLEASNRLFLDQLTFGEPSGDPQATRLPVLLAVALLKNRQGEIDINLPISGSLDDPQFSVGGILWRVVVNLVTKAITAPFALLMGSDGDAAGEVRFAPGSTTLTAAARQQLDALATKLLDRPALKLDAVGQADPALDVPGLREAHVQRLMRQAKAKALDVPVEEVQVAAQEADRWLAAAYRAADIKKPRNLIGVPVSLPPSAQKALLAAAAPVDAAALKTLADRRADGVKAYLIERIPAERVRLGASPVPQAAGEATNASAQDVKGVSLSLQ